MALVLEETLVLGAASFWADRREKNLSDLRLCFALYLALWGHSALVLGWIEGYVPQVGKVFH